MSRAGATLACLAACAHATVSASRPAAGDAEGRVDSVDAFERRIEVSTPAGSLSLRATKNSEIVEDTGLGWLPLSALRPGEEVRVSWRVDSDGRRILVRMQLLPQRGPPPETEEMPPPRDDDLPVDVPAGGLSPWPIGGK